MKQEHNNTPAFPHISGSPNYHQEGMSLRDYFAAKAMAALLSHTEGVHDWADDKIARGSYSAADAMLKERARDNES